MIRLPRQEVAELLAESIDRGEGLLERANLIGDLSDYESWKATRKLWTEHTEHTLGRIYDSSQETDEFRSATSDFAAGGEQWQTDYRRDSNCVRQAIDVLLLFKEQLGEVSIPAPELHSEEADEAEPDGPLAVSPESEPEPTNRAEPEPEPHEDPELELQPDPEPEPEPDDDASSASLEIEPSPAPDVEFAQRSANGSGPLPATTSAAAGNGGPGPGASGQVFLVHGRDEGVKQAVTDLLERAGPHEITILNERPMDRRMLVEHFDGRPAGARYAVVLLTADDVGAPRVDSEREPYFSPRARQRVVFEMGLLVAAVTPRRMCVLYEDGVELPFDLDGIAYVRLDLAGTWQSKLLLHMRGAGFEYDLNRLAPI
jgi:predicted nucleotide-binding protein